MAAQAPAPAPEPEPPVPAPAPEPEPPVRLSGQRFLNFQSVCCEIPECKRYALAAYNRVENTLRFTCREHAAFVRIVRNTPPEAHLLHVIKESYKDPTFDTVRIRCPDAENPGPNNTEPCQGQKCTFYRLLRDNDLTEFLVCHTCKGYWRV